MNGKDVIIIGSGLGGLSSGVFLAKAGYRVVVLEQSTQIGGCLQCFKRKGVKFETGMHFIGSADKGQILYKLMRNLEIEDKVQLSRLGPDGYDVISLCGKKYKFANGREAFIKQMADYFPDQQTNLERYWDLIENVANSSSVHTLRLEEDNTVTNLEYQMRSMDEVIDSVITDPLLAKVLAGNLPLYGAEKGKTPFSMHAFIMDFYNQSAFRVVGGSDSIAQALQTVLNKYGGRVLLRHKVTEIMCDDQNAVGVLCENGEVYRADIVISSAHPFRTLEMLGNTSLIRNAYRRRILNIGQTIGGFAVYFRMRDSLSVERHIPEDCPPVFLVNCKDDPVVKYHNSELLDSALTSKGIPHRYIQYQTGGHGFGASNVRGTAECRQWRSEFMKWIKELYK